MEYWVCPVSKKKRKEKGKYSGKSEPPNLFLSAGLLNKYTGISKIKAETFDEFYQRSQWWPSIGKPAVSSYFCIPTLALLINMSDSEPHCIHKQSICLQYLLAPGLNIVCTPAKVRGQLEFWNFGFLGEVKMFLISGAAVLWGEYIF